MDPLAAICLAAGFLGLWGIVATLRRARRTGLIYWHGGNSGAVSRRGTTGYRVMVAFLWLGVPLCLVIILLSGGGVLSDLGVLR